MSAELEKSLAESVKIVVEGMMASSNCTGSMIGKVKSIDKLICNVNVNGVVYQCRMFVHLFGRVNVGDMVIVQDLSNDSVYKCVVSKLS